MAALLAVEIRHVRHVTPLFKAELLEKAHAWHIYVQQDRDERFDPETRALANRMLDQFAGDAHPAIILMNVVADFSGVPECPAARPVFADAAPADDDFSGLGHEDRMAAGSCSASHLALDSSETGLKSAVADLSFTAWL